MLLSSLGLNPVSSISSRGRHRSPPGITFAPGCSLSYQGERPGATGGDKEEVPCSADAPQMPQSTSKKRPAGETEARRMAEAGPSLHALPGELYSEGSRWRAKKRGHVVLLKNQPPSLGRQPLPSTAWAQKPCPKPALQRQKQSLEALNGAQCPLLAGFYVKKKAQRPLGGSWSPQLFPKCEGGGCNSGAACALAAMSTAQSRKRQILLTRPILNSVQMGPFNDLDSCLVLFFPPCKRSLEIACCLGKHRRQHQRLGTGSSASPASSSPASLGSS